MWKNVKFLKIEKPVWKMLALTSWTILLAESTSLLFFKLMKFLKTFEGVKFCESEIFNGVVWSDLNGECVWIFCN
jgi:hypothetical protein